jgi:hypothetical protein
MIAATEGCCAAPLLLFLRTLLDITLLRKGPQDLPRSPVTLFMASLFWLFVILFSQVVLFGLSGQRFFLEIVLLAVALAIYYLMLAVNGKSARVGQCIAAILGAGAMVMLLFVLSTLSIWRFFGPAGVQFAVAAFMIWSVCAKGHIIAQGLDRQWFVGAILAFAVVALQLLVGDLMQAES